MCKYSFNIEEFLNKLPSKKKLSYLRGYDKLLNGTEFPMVMEAVVKQKEVNKTFDGFLSDRPRVIWNPPEETMLLVTAFNSVLV